MLGLLDTLDILVAVDANASTWPKLLLRFPVGDRTWAPESWSCRPWSSV